MSGGLSFSKQGFAVVLIVAFLQAGLTVEIYALDDDRDQVTITIDPLSVASFDPHEDLGAGIDGQDYGRIDKLLSAANIREMLSVGFEPITFRLRTELANDVWHWNPEGTWTDESNRQGYWTSDSKSDADISLSYGYRLPRRGNTIDQANNDGYSRIDDGDTTSYWKSNPYLDKHFTNDDNANHQQWVVVDLGTEKLVDTIRVLWGLPFAAEYEVQFGRVNDISDISQNPPKLWLAFKNGKLKTRTGGEITTRLTHRPVRTRYIRVLLKESSFTAPIDSRDIRDSLGFAIREIYLGTMDSGGHFTDEVRHGTETNQQTNIYVSSTDPWHRLTDIDVNTEHAGFGRLFKSGLTDGAPVLMPVGVLYNTPENAAGEVGYLIRKGYKIERVEIGEEPDGQYVTPEDYGALYIQWADAIHKVAPDIKLGGPSFQDILSDTRGVEPELGNPLWLERFVHYLDKHHHAADFSFFSFEWYPFDQVCTPTAPQIAQTARLLSDQINILRQHGLRSDIPLVISEYGYSAFATAAEVDIEGALFNADTVGAFLTLGGSSAYLYGYEPNRVEKEMACTAGNNMLFLADYDGNIEYKTSTYFGARLMMNEWLQPTGGVHKIYPCKMSSKGSREASLISAYAVRRPDRKWALMLINKDPQHTLEVNFQFKNESVFAGEADVYQFSHKQYEWDAVLGRPVKSDPPEYSQIDANRNKDLSLPPYSLTILRGTIRPMN